MSYDYISSIQALLIHLDLPPIGYHETPREAMDRALKAVHELKQKSS
jgi:hypothetical protein